MIKVIYSGQSMIVMQEYIYVCSHIYIMCKLTVYQWEEGSDQVVDSILNLALGAVRILVTHSSAAPKYAIEGYDKIFYEP